jgi:hypothetical protein
MNWVVVGRKGTELFGANYVIFLSLTPILNSLRSVGHCNCNFQLRSSSKVDCSGKSLRVLREFEDFETHFRRINGWRLIKFREAPHIVGQLYGVPHGIEFYGCFNTARPLALEFGLLRMVRQPSADTHVIWAVRHKVTRPQTILKFRPPSSLDYRTRHGSQSVAHSILFHLFLQFLTLQLQFPTSELF